MDMDISGAYSPNTIYGQLTMPFLNKPVHINSHTPYDKTDTNASALSKSDFYKTTPQARVSVEDIHNTKGIALDDELVNDLFKDDKANLLSNNINNFQSSVYKSNKDVVHTALQNGYSAEQAVNAAKAFKAYSANTVNDYSQPIKLLSAQTPVTVG